MWSRAGHRTPRPARHPGATAGRASPARPASAGADPAHRHAQQSASVPGGADRRHLWQDHVVRTGILVPMARHFVPDLGVNGGQIVHLRRIVADVVKLPFPGACRLAQRQELPVTHLHGPVPEQFPPDPVRR
ncbi:MAG: hypothetical protein ACK56I_33980, partial [bacterium]